MPYLSHLFFSFDGRIDRTDYWIAFMVLQAISLCATLAIQPDYFAASVTHPLGLAVLALALMLPQSAVCAKRFRELEWPVWLAFALVGASTAAWIAFDSRLTVDGSAGNLALSVAVVGLMLSEVVPSGFFKAPVPSVDAAFAR